MTGRQKFRIGWVGFHKEGEEAFQALLDNSYNIVGAVTLDSTSVNKRSGSSSYLYKCPGLNIPLHETQHINSDDTMKWLKALELDLLIVIGWSQILSPELLKVANIGVIGAHASLLPNLKGSAPINWAIINGLHKTGNSLIELVENVDSGRILAQKEFPITLTDTCASLYEKVASTNASMLLSVLPKIIRERCLFGEYQKDTYEPLLRRRRPEDGLIDWSKDSHTIYNLVRAVTKPYPGAYTYLSDQKVMIWSATLLPSEFLVSKHELPGKVIGPIPSSIEGGGSVAVVCGHGTVLLINEIEIDRTYRGNSLLELDWSDKTFGELNV